MIRILKNKQGNALFLILIAVALFAALSYAVTQSGRGGSGIDREQAQLGASRMLQFSSAIGTAVQRLRIIGGLSIEDIDFVHDTFFVNGTDLLGYMNNPNCIDASCEVFSSEGGGVSLIGFPEFGATSASQGVTDLHSGYIVIRPISWPGAGTSANDVALEFYFMQPSLCEAYNDLVDVDTAPVVAGFASGANPSNWDSAGITISSGGSSIVGKNTFASSTTPLFGVDSCRVFYLLFER